MNKKLAVLAITSLFALGALAAGCGGDAKKDGGKKVNYPTKPINLIVPYAAGGSADLSARPFADEMNKLLGKPVVVVNKPGAGGGVGAAEVARAQGDGYTALHASIGNVTIVPHTASVGYDYKAFKPVAQMIDIPLVLAVKSDSKIKTLKDYIEFAKANPGKMRYGSPGAGNIQHVTLEGWAKTNNLKLTHTPYAGANPAMAALLGGHIESTFTGVTEALPHAKSGAVRLLAITGNNRVECFPDVPGLKDVKTFKELGWDLQSTLWYGMLVPAKTPDDVVAILADAAKKAYESKKVQDGWKKLYLIPSYADGKTLGEKIKKQSDSHAVILKDIGLKK